MPKLATQLLPGDVLKLTLKINTQVRPSSSRGDVHWLSLVTPKRTKDTTRSVFFCWVLANNIVRRILTVSVPDTEIDNAVKNQISYQSQLEYRSILSLTQYLPSAPAPPECVVARLLGPSRLGNRQPNLALTNPIDFIDNINIIID